MVMNARRIEECLQSYRDLLVDKLWIKNMTEETIERRWPEIMEQTEGYARLALVSDDTVVRGFAWDAVTYLAQLWPVVTGYCNLDQDDMRVNIEAGPLARESTPDSHDFYTLGQVLCWQEKAVPTALTGFSITMMKRELWEKFPFKCDGGADFNLSRRLAGAGIPIVAAREGFCWHVKERWNHRDEEPRKRLLIGEEPEGIELERWNVYRPKPAQED